MIGYDTSSPIMWEKIQRKIQTKLSAISPDISLEAAAHKHNIVVDEGDNNCRNGERLAQELYAFIAEYQHAGSPKDLLPLQREDLWHKWAVLDKEQYRQKRQYKHEQYGDQHQGVPKKLLTKEYGELQRKNMKEIRLKQYPLATKALNMLMTTFVANITKLKEHELWYYMTWLKFKLDDLSRKILPPFHARIRKKRSELSEFQKQQDESAEDKCHKELKALDMELINASFGLEHLLREASQIYEAVAAHGDILNNPQDPVARLPQIVAQLLCDGFPIELLDGDASHMPQKWISAVLTSLSALLHEKLSCEPKIYTLSVLGVQSTGKSTLLNTLFGVQFSVSAGRCTRGAFMQLIPVHPSLLKQLGVHYFLLIDTEGLRAPELDRLNAREHDNELATFVIGVANQTLINVAGEVAGDMDDILHTAVHAFLRMSQVSLKPSCHIVHQHVAAVGAEEKMIMGRFKTKDNLDKMTKAAAKESGVETRYTLFTDVIKFDHEKDLSFFPDLWNGKPPMARVSSGYTEAAKQLKLAIINSSVHDAKYQTNSILNIKAHLESLWKAILQEDFVFSFQNTFEIVAFKTLEGKYGDWSWSFKNDMNEWERRAQHRLMGCTPDQLYDVYQELLQSLTTFVSEKYRKYEATINSFFDEGNEIMLKWKPDTELRLRHLSESLQRHAQTHCLQLYQSRRGRADAENKKEELSVRILEKVQQLVGILDKNHIGEEEVMKMFEENWSQWICDLTATVKPLVTPNILVDAEECVTEFYKEQRKFVHQKLADEDSGKPLKEWGSCLDLKVKDCHIQVLQPRIWGLALISTRKVCDYYAPAQKHTDTTLGEIGRHLTKIRHSGENFKPQHVTELLRIVQSNRKIDSDEYQFTDEYEVDMGLTACGYAIPVFNQMAEIFRKTHDPLDYIQYELKPHFKAVFRSKYNEVDDEKITAETVCQQLKKPIKECVMEDLSSLLVNEMRGTYSWIKVKPSLIAKVLLEIGKKLNEQSADGFHHCITFITHPKESLQVWAEYFTETHCDSGTPSRVSVMVLSELSETVEFIIAKVKLVTHSHAQQQTFSVDKWLREFHAQVSEKIEISLTTLCAFAKDKEFPDANFFAKEVIKGLNSVSDEVKEKLSKIKYAHTCVKELAHEVLYDAASGCTEQCPFCKAQCEHNTKNHPTSGTIKHEVQHRPRGLGGRRWDKDNTLVLDTCPVAVHCDHRFQSDKTNYEWHDYKKYADHYPEWSIPSDNSLESSLYWKWFIGKYSTKVEEFFGRAKTEIPQEWSGM